MSIFEFLGGKTGLLVSVRDAAEARAALAGGADVIDVKEPNRGALGAADEKMVSDVVLAVNDRAPVSAAMGELVDLIDSHNGDGTAPIADGVSLFKIGLANCAGLKDWQTYWQHAGAGMASSSMAGFAQPVAVIYADWHAAHSPPPHDVLRLAIERRCPALLVDTWGKSDGTLFDHWRVDDLREFLADARSHNLATVLAGSLTRQNIIEAARLAPNLVAVRTAACDGGREGIVSERRVRELKNAIVMATRNIAVN